MKTVWKWILGIVIVLVVAGLVVGGVFAVQHRFTVGMRSAPFAYRQFQQTTPATPSKPNTQNNQNQPTTPTKPTIPNTTNRNMMGRGFGWGNGYGPMMGRGPITTGRGPMVMGRGNNQFGRSRSASPFGIMAFMFFGLFGLIVLLAAFTAVAFVFYQLGKNAGISSALLTQLTPKVVAATETDAPARGNRARR